MPMRRTGCGGDGSDKRAASGRELSLGVRDLYREGPGLSHWDLGICDDVFHSIAPGTAELAMGMKGARPISRQLSAISYQLSAISRQ